MTSNFAVRTFVLLTAWLAFENFNLLTEPATRHTVYCSSNSILDLNPAVALTADGISQLCLEGRKSRESLVNRPDSLAQSPPYKIKTIVLDAGHGGKDPGCVGASAFEKENALAIVLRLGAYIEANYPEIKVIYTRDADFFVELNERAAIANRNNADLFISVHCNSMSVKSAKGAETYVMGLHRAEHNLEVAKRENASIYLEEDYQKNYEGYDPNSPEAEIFASVWQSAYLEQSILLASYVQQFASAVAFRDDRGVKQAGFLVLRETAMPSVLIEAGYLTNATEEAFLASDEGQEQMALSIFQAFEAYKRHMETGKPVNNVVDVPAPIKPASSPAKVNKPAPAKTIAQKLPATSVQATEKPATKTSGSKTTVGSKPVALKTPVPVNYTIFLLSWPNKLDPNVGQLSLLANVREVKKENKYHYYSGVYTTKAEAEKVLPEIQNMGFKTATIVQD